MSVGPKKSSSLSPKPSLRKKCGSQRSIWSEKSYPKCIDTIKYQNLGYPRNSEYLIVPRFPESWEGPKHLFCQAIAHNLIFFPKYQHFNISHNLMANFDHFPLENRQEISVARYLIVPYLILWWQIILKGIHQDLIVLTFVQRFGTIELPATNYNEGFRSCDS